MANHKSSEKRIRQDEARKVNNKYYARTTRNALKELRSTTDKTAAAEMLPKVSFHARQTGQEKYHSSQ